MGRVAKKLADREPTASVAEMMEDLDAIARQHGIVWTVQDGLGTVSDRDPNRPTNSGGSRGSVPTRAAKPRTQWERGATPSGPSEAQINYVKILWEQCKMDLAMDLDKVRSMTSRQVSNLIQSLKLAKAKIDRTRPVHATQQSRPSYQATRLTVDEGIYIVDGTVFKVINGKASGKPYAKRLIVHEYGDCQYEYDPGAITRIKPEHAMSYEQALEFGERYGVCCNCARKLTNPDSIEAGIGPICRGKFGR